MAAIHVGTGVITEYSKDYGVVAINIGGTSRSFLFSKTIFYTFGLKCEGLMSNVLEEGMEVVVCNKVSHLNNKPSLVAVWLGDKPDFLNEENTDLKAVYDEDGHVINLVDFDIFLVQNDNSTVVVYRDVVFRDGLPLDGDAVTVDVGEEIKYDAVPFHFGHPSGALYEATCAWIGIKPKIVERFNLNVPSPPEVGVEFSKKELVYGTVTVIPNEVVAFVDVEVESALVKVLVFRDSFEERSVTIQEMITLGDILCMRVASRGLFQNRPQWFAKTAFKVTQEIILDTIEMNTVEEEFGRECCSEFQSIELDEKSDLLFRDPPLTGVLTGLLNGSGACINYENLQIFVEMDNFFVNGKPCSDSEFSSWVSKSVNFEAVSSKFFLKERIDYTHEACCVWVGKKPTWEEIMKSFPQGEFSCGEEKIFYGVVKKFLLPSAALAVLPGRMTTVLVRVDEFWSRNDVGNTNLITDYVKLRDHIQLKIKKEDEILLAFDVRVAKFSDEVCERMNLDVSASVCLSDEPAVLDKSSQEQNVVATTVVKYPKSETATAVPFKSCRFPVRGFLLNCLGTLKLKLVESEVVMTMEHGFGSTKIVFPFTLTNVSLSGPNFENLKLNGRPMRFDAECLSYRDGNYDFTILKMWDENESRFDSDHLLARYLPFSGPVECLSLIAKVVSIPLHDRAILSAEHVDVIVSLESLVTFNEINLFSSSIDQFLSLGDFVYVEIEKQFHSSCGDYYRAIKCYKLNKKPRINLDDEVVLDVPRTERKTNVWGVGEYFQKGKIIQRKDEFFVDLISSKNPVRLNLFEEGNVFVHGKLTGPESIRRYVGSEITCHVARLEKMFVSCAWIGKMPPGSTRLQRTLAAPKGFVSRGLFKYCEAVVDSFPLPTHVVCFIGHVPVLVMDGVKFDFATLEYVDSGRDLKKGDLIFVYGVQEIRTPFGDLLIVGSLTDNPFTGGEGARCKDVFRNLIGTVVVVPEPAGLIKAGNLDIEIEFELCHVRSCDKNVNRSDEQWFDYLREAITVGKQVYFSAMKVRTFSEFVYRAVEVRLVNESSGIYSESV